jgi:TatD DNase family protein
VYYVDAHVHIDRYPKPADVLVAAERAGVVVVAVTETPSDYQSLSLLAGRRKLVRVALGLHPLRAARLGRLELSLFSRLLSRVDYVGEVGLDGSRHGRETLVAQRRIFEHALTAPGISEKVLSVHSRGAEAETIALLAQARATAVLHWYSGALKHLDAALAAGLFFSVNPAMVGSAKGRRILAALPPERVLTETDGPYTMTAGKPSTPAHVPALVGELARLWNREAAAAAVQVFENMAALRHAATKRTESVDEARPHLPEHPRA